MTELKPCPFCGGTALKLDSKSVKVSGSMLDARVEAHTYSVRCNRCHARGPAAGGKVVNSWVLHGDIPKWATTDEQLQKKAADAWNRRAES